MFIGHFGVGLLSKKINSKPSLGTYFIAAQFIDLLWPVFIILGIEKVKIEPGNTEFTPLNFIYYPFSHGLLSVIIWAVIFAIVYYLLRKNWKASLLLGAVVISHWVLDLLTHRPDLPLMPGSEIKAGLGLWNNILFTIIVEVGIFALGIFYYLKITRAKNKASNFIFWGLIVFLTVIYFMNIFGPPPPSEQAIGYVGLSMWLLVAWGYWADRTRAVKEL